MIRNRIKALFNPSLYHGWGRNKKFFEGWYYKIVSADKKHAFAIIPGVAMNSNGEKHAFVQVLEGKTITSAYHEYDFKSFSASSDKHEVKIENSYFNAQQLTLQLPNFTGELHLNNLSPWSSSKISPGIMGPFAFMPFMECYHGILSMDHTLSGFLKYKDETIDFNGGKGYLEKDWGHSFPTAYVWMQCNHFSEDKISVKASIAKIPWLGFKFTGFIAGVWLKGKLIEFTTYNFTQLKKLKVNDTQVCLTLKNRKYILEIIAERGNTAKLNSPLEGMMTGIIEESMDSILNVKLINRKTKQIVLEDRGIMAGLEVAGKIESIIKG